MDGLGQTDSVRHVEDGQFQTDKYNDKKADRMTDRIIDTRLFIA